MLQQELQVCVSLIDELQANRERKKDNESVAKKNTAFLTLIICVWFQF